MRTCLLADLDCPTPHTPGQTLCWGQACLADLHKHVQHTGAPQERQGKRRTKEGGDVDKNGGKGRRGRKIEEK